MYTSLKSWWSKERGVASISMFILSIPLIVGSFGFGFDEVRGIYLKNYIQSRADLAVENAVALDTKTLSSGALSIDPSIGDQVSSNYKDNTLDYRNQSILSCTPSQTVYSGISGSYYSSTTNTSIHQDSAPSCTQTVTILGDSSQTTSCKDLSTNTFANPVKYGVHFEVKEKINTVFLRILGINTINLGTVKAETLIRPNCP